ncbi:MAG TPA: DUF309 domain-containing protein [Verrucomicrobiae bacterium]|nr:DUF309 domain-containing protein [Verrucomicrobiae bacterium]
MSENETFKRGVAHFNAREFFEAHEAWEELWLPADEPEKTFLQGMIQIAAAFHHYQRRNPRGTKSLLSAGLGRLESCPKEFRSMDMARLRNEAGVWLDALAESEGIKPSKLPRIHAARRPWIEAPKKKKRRMRSPAASKNR